MCVRVRERVRDRGGDLTVGELCMMHCEPRGQRHSLAPSADVPPEYCGYAFAGITSSLMHSAVTVLYNGAPTHDVPSWNDGVVGSGAGGLQLQTLYTYIKVTVALRVSTTTLAARENLKFYKNFVRWYSRGDVVVLVIGVLVVLSTRHTHDTHTTIHVSAVYTANPRIPVTATCSKTSVIHFIDP